MKHLFKDWKRIEGLIKKSSSVLLLADYDGTLTPIAPRPEGAALGNDLKKILKALSKNKKFYVGIISGRRIDDVKNLAGLNNIFYSGNHGLDIEGPGIKFLHHLCRRFKSRLIRVRDELILKTKGIKGAIVEYKTDSISLHYRLVKKRYVKKLKAIFDGVSGPYAEKGVIKISSGKKVWEIRLPLDWNKGDAAGRIISFLRKKNKDILPVYLGDDATDEDVFKFLKNKKSLTVFVGRKKSSGAKYYLKSPREVKEFLVRLCLL